MNLTLIRTIDIECSFDYIRGWPYDIDAYSCTVKNFITVTEQNNVIESAVGSHGDEKGDLMVEALHLNKSSSSQVHYLPRGLNVIFLNLKRIYVEGVGLKEVHQSDFKALPELQVLSFYDNNLEYLEKDLFKFNTKLHTFGANFNKISLIHPDIFDHLHGLTSLRINGNPCSLTWADKNRERVLEIIVNVKEKCSEIKTEVLDDLIVADCEVSGENTQ